MTTVELDALLAEAKPHESSDGVWYWGTKDDEPDPDGDEWRLPPEIMELIPGRLTYPDAKRFNTEAAAMDALRDAVTRCKEQPT